MNTNQESRRVVDTTELHKIDVQFSKLQQTSSPVAVYRYDASSHLWKKTDTIGSLYLYERHSHPQYGIIVSNHQNSNNFRQLFDSNGIFVMHQPYLLIRAVQDIQKDPRDGQEIIHCIWFHEPRDCMASANILREMGLKFEGEGNTFDKVGEGRTQMSENSPSSAGNHMGNHLYQILRTGTKEPIDECDFSGGPSTNDKPRGSNGPDITPRMKQQCGQAMVFLLQTDHNFVNQIHNGYEDSVKQ